jgi:hypothetical protein
LLVCGILSPVLHAVSDVLAGMQWEGYTLFAVLLLVVYGLIVAFGVGVWKATVSLLPVTRLLPSSFSGNFWVDFQRSGLSTLAINELPSGFRSVRRKHEVERLYEGKKILP